MKASIVATLLGAAACFPAWAVTVQTAVTLDNFNVQVTDLRPGDGTAPWFKWGPRSIAITQSEAYSYPPDSGDKEYVEQWRHNTSAIDVHGSASTSPTSFQAATGWVDAPAGITVWSQAYAGTFLTDVWMSPHTSLTLSGNVSASIFSDAASGSTDSYLNVTLVAGPFDRDVFHRAVNGAMDDTASDLLSVTFANATDHARLVYLSVSVSTKVMIFGEPTTQALVVPEPGTSALMLVGLAGVAGLARRSRKA
jgi:hypothetical protein